MALEAGATLGSYEILGRIGSASGEAYRASDTRSGRVVVLKMLPPELSNNAQARALLKRDVEKIAALNHPHITVAHEVGDVFAVTEHVDGESLAQRLERGPLSIDEALTVAIAIADALDRAHRQGVVHRGLTPSSVILAGGTGSTGSPLAKLVDFGLSATPADLAPAGSGSFALTRTSMSAAAAIPLATAPYMAPEQFDGLPADARSDIFAFGAVLYEMLTGRKAFDGKTQALVIAAVQTVDPEPASKLQPMVPPALDHVVARCLTKDPKQRLQTAWDLLGQLRWITDGGSQIGIPAPVAARRQKRDRLVWTALAAGALLVTGVAAPSALSYFKRSAEPEVARFVVTSVGQTSGIPVSISPDGRWIIGTKGGAANRGIDALPLNSVTAQTLVGDSVLYQPFWSWDSRSIGFFEDGKLKKADASGGPSQTICEVSGSIGGGTWSRDGVILFSAGGVIQRVLAAGGQPTPVTELNAAQQETEHMGPYFLPDGRHFVFLAVSSRQGGSGIEVGSLDSKERRRLFESESKAVYAAPGFLLFNRGNTVFAQPFDAGKLALTGEAVRVADGVPLTVVAPGSSSAIGRFATFAASQTGVLIFRTGATGAGGPTGPEEQRSLVWLDRNGGRVAQIEPVGSYAGLDLAPDDKRFAVHRHEAAGGDSWVFDVAQGRLQRLTFDATQDNQAPLWSPDGTRIAFGSRRKNLWGLYLKQADGTGAEELITESETVKAPMSWSPDGKLLLYVQGGSGLDVWAVPVSGDRKPFALLQSPFNENFPQVSSDGKWMAYQSNETGRPEIYVKQFPDGPGKWQVSTEGGQYPRWRRDGKELFFVTAPNMVSVDIRVVGASVQAGVPQTLFAIPNPNTTNLPTHAYHRYAVTADGQRFIFSMLATGAPVLSGGLADSIAALADQGGTGVTTSVPNAITVVVNWPQALKRK